MKSKIIHPFHIPVYWRKLSAATAQPISIYTKYSFLKPNMVIDYWLHGWWVLPPISALSDRGHP